MPNLPGRYAYSAIKSARAEPLALLGESVPGVAHPCGGGCGEAVTTAKCSSCAAGAVADWLRSTGKARIAERYYTGSDR